MEKEMISKASAAFLLALSIIGLALTPVLVVLPNLKPFQVYFHKSLIGVLFTAVCLLGIAAAFYPSKCRGMFEETQNPLPQANKSYTLMQVKGHHPDCQEYSGNRIKIGGRVFCAACSGLLFGATIALIGTAIYFFIGVNLAWDSVWLLALGEIWMLLGLAQIKFAGYFKVLANVLFVVGSFATLVATDAIGKSLLVDLYVLGVILFLLWFRIYLSEWNNKRTCRKCQSCVY